MTSVSLQTYSSLSYLKCTFRVSAQATMIATTIDSCSCSAVEALERFISLSEISHLVLSHFSPKEVPSVKAFLQKRKGGAELQISLSNPAMQVLKQNMGQSPHACIRDFLHVD